METLQIHNYNYNHNYIIILFKREHFDQDVDTVAALASRTELGALRSKRCLKKLFLLKIPLLLKSTCSPSLVSLFPCPRQLSVLFPCKFTKIWLFRGMPVRTGSLIWGFPYFFDLLLKHPSIQCIGQLRHDRP